MAGSGNVTAVFVALVTIIAMLDCSNLAIAFRIVGHFGHLGRRRCFRRLVRQKFEMCDGLVKCINW